MSTRLWNEIKRRILGKRRDNPDPCSENAPSERPSLSVVRGFFSKRSALVSLLVLISLFLLVGVGPMLLPMDPGYTDVNLSSIAPNFSLLSVPQDLKGKILSIDGYSGFTVGLSEDGRVYAWGDLGERSDGAEISVPGELSDTRIARIAAGYDHVIAVTEDGRTVGWGSDSLGQYGRSERAISSSISFMPEELTEGLDPKLIGDLCCAYQVTALVYDGVLYAWGNGRNMLNMQALKDGSDGYRRGEVSVKEVALTNYYGAVLYDDGSVYAPLALNERTAIYSSDGGKLRFGDINEPIISIAATADSFALVTESGRIYTQGPGRYGENLPPTLPSGERAVSVEGGSGHFVLLSDAGRAYGWGHNDAGQAEIYGRECAAVYTGAKQTYIADTDGRLIEAVGQRFYPFGTDSLGRDVLTRVLHGGRTTMTVGAVAVIVSLIVAVTVGIVAGYFGGFIDTLLMRVTEIFSAIPFLPFAMLLSYVVRKNPIDEQTRIIIIMVILGLLSWPSLARLVRAEVMVRRGSEFVISARAVGVSEGRIAFRHILPNVVSVILVSATLDFAGCLLIESSLSYLGFGVEQPMPTWGNMLSGANSSALIRSYPWQWMFPALFLALATVSINIIGDALRDALDPKSRER